MNQPKHVYRFNQHRSFLLFITTLFLCLNFSVGDGKANPEHHQSSPHDGHEIKMNNIADEVNKIEHDHHHSHKSLDISDNSRIPTLDIKVDPDALKGWNLEIKTTNFTFSPETLNQNSLPNQGHAHLYVNDKKITRIYGSWYYISELPEGENEIKVTLNTDNHEDLIYQGKMISDRIIINNQ